MCEKKLMTNVKMMFVADDGKTSDEKEKKMWKKHMHMGVVGENRLSKMLQACVRGEKSL